MGVAALRMILVMNSVEIRYTQQELVSLGLGIAQRTMDVDAVAQWIRTHEKNGG